MSADAFAGVPRRRRIRGQGQPTRLVHAAASDAVRAFVEAGVRANLVYIDPPFAAERDFFATTPSGERRLAYSDRWDGLEAYLVFMREVLAGIHALLTPEGSLLLHCDHRAAPYLATACDAIFGFGDRQRRGTPGFRNELVWSYGLGGSSNRCYPKKHDTILWYSRGASWYFDPPRVPATSRRMAGQTKKAPDVLAIPTINNMAIERAGYPTQKPLELLELLVRAHTRPAELVVDLFCGSGTTALAAVNAGREALAADLGLDALAVSASRLAAAGHAVDVFSSSDPSEVFDVWNVPQA